MNLVQINERLKDLPMQVLQQYANGMNPEVPPYLALGELQRREISQKQMATAQGGQQGPQPSVKEQVEQKAGLMALQQMQQQQAAQQMQQPRGPMPAPEGVPQPEMQPQAMMARGGLAGIPVRRDMFEYAGGGIIAFQSGGKPPRIQDEVPISEEERERLRNELITRIVGEEARNPPVRRKPMEITESDTMTVPGMESSNLMARALAEARGPQPDNRALLNQIDARDARRNAMLEREAAKAAARPKYETPYDRMNRENRGEMTQDESAKSAEREALISQIPNGGQTVSGGDRVEGGEFGRNVKNTMMSLPGASAFRALSGGAGSARGVSAALAALLGRREEEGSPAEAPAQAKTRDSVITSQGPGDTFKPRRPIEASGLPEVLKKVATDRPAPPAAGPAAPPAPGAPRPAAPRPAASAVGAPAGIAAALPQAQQGTSPLLAEAAALAREKPTAPTPASIIAEQNQLLPAGMQEEAMKKMFADQRARAEARQAAYEKSKPSGLDDLIRVYGQAAQYKGGTGLAPAYTSLQQQRRAEDLAMQKQQDELMTAIEGRQYGADEKLFGAREKSLTAAQTSYQNRLTNNTKALADLAGVDQRRMDEAAQRLNQMQVAKLQAATAARPSEAERIEAQYMGLLAKGKAQEAEEYLSRISRIKGGAGVDRNPTPTDRLRAAQSIMNDIDSSAEEKAMAKKEIASIMSGNKPAGNGKEAGTPLPPNASPKNLVVGTVYQTAKGPAKWTGTGFMPI